MTTIYSGAILAVMKTQTAAITEGSTVAVSFTGGKTVCFTIYSPADLIADNAALPRSGVVSSEAPIARAVLGKTVGEFCSYEAGGLTHIVRIERVE